VYKKIPNKIKTTPTATMVNYATTFEPYFSFMLRERKPITPTNMQFDAVEIKGNLTAAGKLRRIETEDEIYKVDQVKGSGKYKYKKKLKEEPNYSTYNKDTTEEKIEEMTRLIRNM